MVETDRIRAIRAGGDRERQKGVEKKRLAGSTWEQRENWGGGAVLLYTSCTWWHVMAADDNVSCY